MMEQNYLTDEELDALIREVEASEMTMAPPDLLDDILQKMDVSECAMPPRILHREKRRNEFLRYCLQVASGVAAAVVLLFLLPTFSGGKEMTVPAKEQVLAASDVKSKEDVLERRDNRLMSRLGNSRYLDFLRSDESINDISSEDGVKNRIFNWRTNQ